MLPSLKHSHSGLVLHPQDEDFLPQDHFGCCAEGITQGFRGPQPRQRPQYSFCTKQIPGIQASVPVDNVESCDLHAPPITLASGAFANINPSWALYSEDAFWALPFYSKPKQSSIIDMLWGLIAQKLLWISGNNLLINTEHSKQNDPSSDAKFEGVSETLRGWKCHSQIFSVCILDLVQDMAEQLNLEQHYVDDLHLWLKALNGSNYQFPLVSPSKSGLCKADNVLFHPVCKSLIAVEDNLKFKPINTKTPNINLQEHDRIYRNTCPPRNVGNSHINFELPWVSFPDVLLIVVFNKPHYESIPFVDTLYRPFFPNILYCGPGFPNMNSQELKNLKFSFYSFGQTKKGHQMGSFNYECMIKAVEMFFPVSGYWFVSDDLLLSVHKIKNFRLNRTAFVPLWDIVIDDVSDCIISKWGFRRYRKQIMNVLKNMEALQGVDVFIEYEIIQNDSLVKQQCYKQLVGLNGGPYRVNGGLADIYYIPQEIAADFAVLGSLFLEHDVFLEVAVPTLMQCLVGIKNVQELVGEYRQTDRSYPWLKFTQEKFIDKSYMYIHPTKWGHLASGGHDGNVTKVRELYCERVLPWIHDPEGKLPAI